MALIDISKILGDPKLRFFLVFLPNFAWFFAGFVQFCFRAHLFRGALSASARRQVSPKIGDLWHQDLLIYLGAMGGSLALSVLDAARTDLLTDAGLPGGFHMLRLYLRLWGAAHASQSIVGWSRIRPSGRWAWAAQLGPITYTDTALWIWDWTLSRWQGSLP